MKKLLAFKALLLLIAIVEGETHPHVGIEVELNCDFSSDELLGFQMRWIFNKEQFDTGIVSDYDSDKNGILNKREIGYLYENAFVNVKKHSYFTFTNLNRSPVELPDATQFLAYIDNDREDSHVVYDFYLPLHIPLTRRNQRLSLELKDPTNFISVSLKNEEAVNCQDQPNVKITHSIRRRIEQFTFVHDQKYVGEIPIEEVRLRFRKR